MRRFYVHACVFLWLRTVRVWDYTKDNCVMVLKGHTAPVRGLLWNSEIPYLLISGSWDYSIRVWDVRDGACLDTVLDHGGDVYGNHLQCRQMLRSRTCFFSEIEIYVTSCLHSSGTILCFTALQD